MICLNLKNRKKLKNGKKILKRFIIYTILVSNIKKKNQINSIKLMNFKIKRNFYRFISIILIISILFMALRFNFYKVALIDQIQEMNLKTPKSSYFNNSADPILIDGNGGWVSAATNEDWCTLINSVYVIENLTIRGQSETICIEIKNSDVSFLIRNCTLYNAGGTVVGYPGLKLDNVTNGIIIKNNISNNYDIGIILDDSSNNTITENHIENNEHCGILFRDNSDFNKIFNNTFMSNENYGIQLEWESNVNAVYENIIKESTGVYIWGDDNQIFDNKFIRCWNGISIEGADNITIMNNFITDIDTTLSGYAISLEDANLNMIYKI